MSALVLALDSIQGIREALALAIVRLAEARNPREPFPHHAAEAARAHASMAVTLAKRWEGPARLRNDVNALLVEGLRLADTATALLSDRPAAPVIDLADHGRPWIGPATRRDRSSLRFRRKHLQGLTRWNRRQGAPANQVQP